MSNSDITIQPANALKLSDRPVVRVTPVYLVLSEDPCNKTKLQKFLAIKLDDLTTSIKLVGVDIQEDINKICENYQEILRSTDKGLYKEVMLPWQRVIRIQNLIFKQK